jgi:hypothetical protein
MLDKKRFLLLVAAALLAEPALALRCKGRIVSEGDPQAKVLRFCGAPTSTQQSLIYRSGIPRVPVTSGLSTATGDSEFGAVREELLIHERSLVEVLVEEWTYNLGPHKLMRIVRFENGLVTDVRQLGYGFRE